MSKSKRFFSENSPCDPPFEFKKTLDSHSCRNCNRHMS